MDPPCVRIIKRPLSGRGPGHVTEFPNRDIGFKFGTYIEDGLLRRVDRKLIPKWAWPGSRDPISKCWDTDNNC